MMANVSVIIVNWNTASLLERCLTSLYSGSAGVPLEVWVVDNASSDGSIDLVKDQFQQVHLIENHENLGFARANNQALQLASGPYFLLLNSDAFLAQGTLENMVQIMEAQSNIAALGCKLVYEDGTLQRSCQSFPSLATEIWQCFMLDRLFRNSKLFGQYMMTYWKMDDFREVDVVMGAVMLLRGKALEQVGRLDEDYFMYSEEVDLCYRLKRAGWKVVFTPEVQAVHLWGGSSRQAPAETVVRLYRSRVTFFRKHYSQQAAFLFKMILLLESFLRISGGQLIFKLTRRQNWLIIVRNYRMLLNFVWGF